MKNTFKVANANVSIETGFIPHGKEYVRLQEIIQEKAGGKGSFRMQFLNLPYWTNAQVLQVNYSKTA